MRSQSSSASSSINWWRNRIASSEPPSGASLKRPVSKWRSVEFFVQRRHCIVGRSTKPTGKRMCQPVYKNNILSNQILIFGWWTHPFHWATHLLTLEVCLSSQIKLSKQRESSQLLPYRVKTLVDVRAPFIHLIQEDDTWKAVIISLSPYRLRLSLHSLWRV